MSIYNTIRNYIVREMIIEGVPLGSRTSPAIRTLLDLQYQSVSHNPISQLLVTPSVKNATIVSFMIPYQVILESYGFYSWRELLIAFLP